MNNIGINYVEIGRVKCGAGTNPTLTVRSDEVDSIKSRALEKTQQKNRRKIFIRNLSANVTERQLRNHFKQYGYIRSMRIARDKISGQRKGYAFLKFASEDSVQKVLAIPEHLIESTKIEVEKCRMKYGKFFVGGVDFSITDKDIKNYFGQFGNVVSVEYPIDHRTKERRSFCFVMLESIADVKALLNYPRHIILGLEVGIRPYIPFSHKMARDRSSAATFRGSGRIVRGASGCIGCGAYGVGSRGIYGYHRGFIHRYGGATRDEDYSRDDHQGHPILNTMPVEWHQHQYPAH